MLPIQWQILYIISIIITLFVMITLLIYALRKRYVLGAWYFISFLLPMILWTFSVAIMALVPPEAEYFWLGIKYFWIAVAPVGLFVFVIDYTSTNTYLNGWTIGALLIIPFLTQIVFWTNQYHGLMIRDIQYAQIGFLTYIPTITFGPYYWVHTGYSYVLGLLSMALIALAMLRGSYLYRRQGALLIIGILSPFITNILLIAKITPREMDTMPFALLLTSLLLGWSVFRFYLLDLAPVARNIFLDTIPDCMLAIDGQGRVIDINRAMVAMIGAQQNHVIGMPVTQVLKPWPVLVDSFRNATSIATEVSINARAFDLLIIPLTDRRAHIRGQLIVLHDITQRKQLEQEREKLILTLQDALSEVKKLSGLLPICASCKKIRDDDGEWYQLERYIHTHSEAEFSHSICPDCIIRLYPEL